MAAEGPLSAAEIYTQVTGGPGTGLLSEAQRGASELSQRLAERANRLQTVRAKNLAGWQGTAADAAANSTAPLIAASIDDAAHLHNATRGVATQMDSFGWARDSVKPVAAQPPLPTGNDLIDVFAGKGDAYRTKMANWTEDSQHNIQVFGGYHSASTANGETMPAQYTQVEDHGGNVTMDEPGKGGIDQPKPPNIIEYQQPHPRGPGSGDPAQPPTPVGSEYRPPGTSDPRSPGGASRQPEPIGTGGQSMPAPGTGAPAYADATHANAYVPRPVNPIAPPGSGGYEFGPTGTPISNIPNTGGPYTSGGGYGSYGSGSYAPGAGSGSGADSRSGGGYRGSGGPNEPAAGARPLATGRGSGTAVPGENAPGGRGNAATPSPGARGANGMPMAPGAGKGKGGEDKERKNPAYLVNPDPAKTFGADQRATPPVIGEIKDKPRQR